MNGPALASIRARLTLSSNDGNRHKGTIACYAGVLNQLLRRYATDTVVARADEEMCNYKQVLLKPLDFFRKGWDLTVRCGGVCNKQTLRGSLLKASTSVSAATCVVGKRKTVR